MENEQQRENLINLIKNFNNSCSECGKLFLGALLEGSTEVGTYPVYVGISSYPLSCGKCPGCAQECYNDLDKYLELHNKAPCLDYEEEGLEKHEILGELDCWMYLEANFQTEQLAAGNPNVEGGELIDLFDLIEEEIIYIKKEKDYTRKQQLLKNLGEDARNQSSESLIEFLEDEDLRIRMEAISILGNNDNLQINEKLLLLLKDENPSIRIKVIEILGKKDDPQIIEKLVDLLKDSNSGVREKLIEILGEQNNPQILQDILDLINDDSHSVRRKVIEVFSRIDNSQVFQKVFDQLKNENQEISKAIEDILKRNSSQNVIEKLIEMLKSDNDKDWVKALEILSNKRRSNYLIEKLNVLLDNIFDRLNFEDVAQIKYLTTILNIDKSGSLMYLIEKYNNKPQKIRLKILDFIGKISDKNVIREFIQELQIYDELIAILKDQNSENNLRILVINLLKNLDSNTKVMNVFITVMISDQESDFVISYIKKVFGELILFKVDNLNYFLNYFIDNYEVFDDKQKRLMYEVLLNYEKEFIRNKDYKKKTEVIEVLSKLLRETEAKIQIKESLSENSLILKKIKKILNKTIERIIDDFSLNYLIPLFTFLKRRINGREYKEMRYKFLQKIKQAVVKSPMKYIRSLEMSDDLKPAFYDIMRDR